MFSQPLAPEAGMQVPFGAVEQGESPDDAVLREAWEETGQHGLVYSTAQVRTDFAMCD